MADSIQKKLVNLLTTIKNDKESPRDWIEDDIDTVITGMEKFSRYFNTVISMDNELQKARNEGYEPAFIRELTQELDAARRSAHISMTTGVNMIDRMCNAYGVEKVFGLGELDIDNAQDRDLAARAGFEYAANNMLSVIGKEALPEHEPGKPYSWQEYDEAMTSIISSHGRFIEKAPQDLLNAAER